MRSERRYFGEFVKRRISEREDLVKVIKFDWNPQNQCAAFERASELGMKDDPEVQSLAEDLAVNGDAHARWGAIRLIDNQEILAHAALHDSEWMIREYAVENLTDQNVLAEVGVNDSDEKIREIARSRIDKPSALKRAKKKHAHDFEYLTLYEKNDRGRMERLSRFKTCKICGDTFCCDDLYQEEPFCDYVWERRRIEMFSDAERVCFSCEETGDSLYGYVLNGA